MVEDRAAPRYRVKKPAWIEHGGDKTTCTVRDLSLTGALLEINCRVVRRTEFRIGIIFE
jgi:hypothetical protein